MAGTKFHGDQFPGERFWIFAMWMRKVKAAGIQFVAMLIFNDHYMAATSGLTSKMPVVYHYSASHFCPPLMSIRPETIWLLNLGKVPCNPYTTDAESRRTGSNCLLAHTKRVLHR